MIICGWRYKSFRKHHNQALIAFQASAFSSIELDYLCADLLQSSSATWGLHINPSELMTRGKEPSLGALRCRRVQTKTWFSCSSICAAWKHRYYSTISVPLNFLQYFYFQSFWIGPVAVQMQTCADLKVSDETFLQIWANVLWRPLKHFNICWHFNLMIKAWTLWKLSFPPN